MTNDQSELSTRIAEKRKEVENYEGVLDRYLNSPSRTNRWYNSGKEHLQRLRDELSALEAQLNPQTSKENNE